MRKTKFYCALIGSALLLANCSKNEAELNDQLLSIDSKKKSFRSDGEYDALGYGYDVMGEYLSDRSVSTLPILDIPRLKQLHNPNQGQYKFYVVTTTRPFSYTYSGSSASDFLSDINRERSFKISAGQGNEKPKEGEKYFSLSIGTESKNQNIDDVKSRISYARHESGMHIKNIRFVDDMNIDSLKKYLAPSFINNLNTMSVEQLVFNYKTHVLLDFDIGGKLSFNFNGNVYSHTSTHTKKRTVTAGLGFVTSLFGININGNWTTTEMNKAFFESTARDSYIEAYGGTNSGLVVTVDANGQISQTLNIGAWQSSVSSTNAALTNIERMVPLYEFIDDPVKKAAVKVAIDEHIAANQLTELGEVPVYRYYSAQMSNHIFNPDPAVHLNNVGWVSEGVAFYAFTTQVSGSVPIFRYYVPAMHNHIFSPDPTIHPGWVRENIAFYAFTTQVSGSVPIYRYYSAQMSNHIFNPDPSVHLNNPGWVKEGIAFYAYSDGVF